MSELWKRFTFFTGRWSTVGVSTSKVLIGRSMAISSKNFSPNNKGVFFPFEPLAKTPTSLGSRASVPGALRSKSVSRRMSVYRSSDAWLDNMRNAVASVGWKLENLKRYIIYWSLIWFGHTYLLKGLFGASGLLHFAAPKDSGKLLLRTDGWYRCQFVSFFLSPLKFARVSKQLIGEATLWFINFWNLRLQETFCLCLYLRQCPLDDFLPLVVAPAPIKPSLGAMWFFCWVSTNWVVWAWRTSIGVAMSLYRSQYALCKSELAALWGAMQCFLAWWNVYWHCQWKSTVYMICNAVDKLKCSRRAALRAVACRQVQPTIHILIMKLDCIRIDVQRNTSNDLWNTNSK